MEEAVREVIPAHYADVSELHVVNIYMQYVHNRLNPTRYGTGTTCIEGILLIKYGNTRQIRFIMPCVLGQSDFGVDKDNYVIHCKHVGKYMATLL
jgi:hypothetical protein